MKINTILRNEGLTNQQVRVVTLVVKNYSNKEISDLLFVTEKTVKFYLNEIFTILSIKSRAQLVVWCLPHIIK